MNFRRPLRSPFWNSTRRRLLTLVLLVVIPALIVQLVGAWSDLRQNISGRKPEVSHVAAHAQADFTILVNKARTVITDLARVNGISSPGNCAQISNTLHSAYERLAPDAVNIRLSDAKGSITCAVNPIQDESNIAAQAYFQNALQTLDLSLGTYRNNPITGVPTLNVAYPVLSIDGSVQTVIIATFEARWLSVWQSEVVLPIGTALTLVTSDGSILQRWVDDIVAADYQQNQVKPWFTRFQKGLAAGMPGVIEAPDLDGVRRLNILVPLEIDTTNVAYLHLGYPVDELYTKAYQSLEWKLALLGLTMLGALLLAWWGSERLFLRPLQQLMRLVALVQAGDLKVRVADNHAYGVRGLSELNQLARSFDRMADALQQRETLRQQSEARFQAIFETSAVGIGIMGLDRKIIDANPAMCRMFGRSYEELMGQTPAIVTYAQDYPRSTQEFEDLLAGKKAFYFDERRYVRKNGEIFWAHVTMSTVRDAAGAPLYMVGMVIDIDEQRRTLEELQQSEARFRAMFESSAIGVLVLDIKTLTFQTNAAARALLDDTDLERKLSNVYEFVHEEYREAERPLLDELLAGKRASYQVEHRYHRTDRGLTWAAVTFSLVLYSENHPRYILAMMEDITERKKAQDALQESEARFRAIYENAAIGISLVAPDQQILAVNPIMVQMSGYSEAELMELRGLGITYPEDMAAGHDEFQEILSGTRPSYQVEKRYVHKNGHIHWMRQTVSPVHDLSGKLLYLVAIAEDIDGQKRAVEELRESEARFRAMFDSAAVGVAVMTLDRRIVQINQTATRLTGYSPEEILKLNSRMLAIEEDRYIDRELFLELVEGKRDQYTAEKRYIRKDGSQFWGRVNFSAVRGIDGKPLYTIGIIEDITTEKRAAERLAAQEAEYRRTLEQRIAERTNELNLANELLQQKAAQEAVAAERTRLARDLHDAVTQTLFSATLISDVLPDLWELDPARARLSLNELRQLTRGALAEMRTLLVELRPNALIEVPLPILLRQLAEAITGRARVQVQLNAEGERKLPPEVQIGLYRIAQEALNNVVKHAKATQAVVTVRLGEPVRLTVADDGKSFDPSAVTADHLGLKIMRERAGNMGAKLSIYSEPGEGTQISVVWESADVVHPADIQQPKESKNG